MMLRIPRPGLLRRYFFKKDKSGHKSWSPDEIDAVLSQYNFQSWQFCSDLGGGNSDNILLQTSQGRKVLKRYYWSLPSTIYEHSIHYHLAKSDFPCTRLAINKDSLTYSFFDSQHYAIYDFIEGYFFSDYFFPAKTRLQLVEKAANLLARYHILMFGFVPAGRKLNGFTPDGTRLWRDVSWHLKVLKQYLDRTTHHSVPRDQASFLRNIKDELRRGLIETGRHFELANSQLQKVVIHGDYAPYNVLFDQKSISAVLDFGDANLNLRAADVARGLSTFAKAGKHGISEQLSKIFLKSYQEKQQLSDTEISAIPDLIHWRYLMSIIQSLFSVMESHLNRKASADHLNFLLRSWKNVRWIREYADELRSVLLSVKSN